MIPMSEEVRQHAQAVAQAPEVEVWDERTESVRFARGFVIGLLLCVPGELLAVLVVLHHLVGVL